VNRVVVTGGAGFVGRRLVSTLVARGWQVWVVDNFSAGRREDLAAMAAHDACRIVEADVADAAALAAVVAESQPSVVFHLAAMHFIPQCEREPVTALETNVVGTQAVVSAVAAHPGCRMVLASTADVYAPSTAPHHEQSAVGPRSIYGLSKWAAERLLQYAGDRGLDYRIARLFNVFGPGDRVKHVLPDIVNGISRDGVLSLGSLDAVRDYVYVDDVAEAFMALAAHDGAERIFNIGTGQGRSVRDLVDGVEAACGFPLSVRTDPAKLRPTERPSLVCDATLARTVLGWTAGTAFTEGLRRVLAERT
jgi:UDP-glucose 4-epimerase